MIGVVHWVHERFVKQLDGSPHGGRNCTCAAAASCAYHSTLGKRRVTGAYIRYLTGDTVGGNTLDQVYSALKRLNVPGLLGPFRGYAMTSLYARLREGRDAVVQGSSRATYGTKWRASYTFRGNHAWHIRRGKGWRKINGYWKPDYVEVDDPLADGRSSGIARSPFWLPRAYFERFCAYLVVGSGTLGYGKAYVMFGADTKPHVHRTVGGVVYLRRHVKLKTGHTIRRRPGGEIIRRTRSTDVFDVWGKITNGPLALGSRIWVCDHSGTRWVHVSAFA